MAFPFTGVREQTHTFRDAKGFTAVVRYFTLDNGGDADAVFTVVMAILTALKTLTNAAYQGSSGTLSEIGVKQYGTAAAYASVRQKARLVLQDSSGGLHAFNIPAAKLSCFDTDEQTVKPSGVSALTALLAQNTAPAAGTPYVVARQGILMQNFMGGFFVARQTRKNKLFYLDAQLTPTEPGD